MSNTKQDSASIAEQMAAAHTSADISDVIERIEAELAEAEYAAAELEAERADVVLTHGNEDEFRMRVFKAGERVKNLQAALAAAETRHEEALDSEAREEIEATAKTVRSEHEDKLKSAWERLHLALVDVIEAGSTVADSSEAVESTNRLVERRHRSDLQFDPTACKVAALDSLGPTAEDFHTVGKKAKLIIDQVCGTYDGNVHKLERRGKVKDFMPGDVSTGLFIKDAG